MHDLCVQQTDQSPYSSPYLRISPLNSGDVAFRYFDTYVTNRQWHRVVAAADTVSAALYSFLNDLNWVGPVNYDAVEAASPRICARCAQNVHTGLH